MFFEEDDGLIDYNRKTPYSFEKIELIDGVKYKVIYNVRRGVADSRIISYEMVKIGDESERRPETKET
jgi:hypothetical protein